MDYLDRIIEEQTAKEELLLARQESSKTPEKPRTTCVDTFAFLGLYRCETGWCRLLADSEKRQIKLERLEE